MTDEGKKKERSPGELVPCGSLSDSIPLSAAWV